MSARAITSSMKFWGRRPKRRAAPRGKSAQSLLDPRAERTHVGAALGLGSHYRHDLAHVLDRGRAGRGDRLPDQRIDLRLAQRRGQVALQHGDLGGFLGHQVGASAAGKLGDGLAALFDHFLENREHLAVVERDALIDFALLDRRQRQSDGCEPLFLAGPHRALHVLGDAFPERHGDAPRLAGAAAHAVAGHALHVALDGGRLLALALLRGLFIELAPTQLGENAGLLAGPFETPQGGIEVLVLTNTNARHRNLKSLIGMGILPDRRVRQNPGPRRGAGDSKGARGAKAKAERLALAARHGPPCTAGMHYNFSSCVSSPSSPPAMKAPPPCSMRAPGCSRTSSSARWSCIAPTGAWCPSWPRATTCGACCRWCARRCSGRGAIPVTSTGWPTQRARASSGRCSREPRWRAVWPTRGARRRSACTTWKDLR